MVKSKSYIGHILVFSTIIIYSFNTDFMKILIPNEIGSFGLVLARCLAMTIFFWGASLFTKEKNKLTLRDIFVISVGGLLGTALNLIFYVKGVELTGPIDATVIRTLQPIMVITISAVLYHSKVSKFKIFGIILGVVGTIYTSITPHVKGVDDSFLGNIFVVFACLSSAIYIIVIKPYVSKYNPITIIKIMSLVSFIIVFPIGYKELIEAPIFHGEPDFKALSMLSYTLLISSVVAYYLTITALRYITPIVQSSYIYVLPIAETCVSILLKVQYPTWHDPVGFLLILGGFLLINKKDKYLQ